MKKLVIVLVALVALFVVVPPLLPSSVGQALYEKGTDLEAALYGLTQQSVDIGDMTISLYSNTQAAEDRPTIVLLHGYSADKDVWPRFAKQLGEQYHLLIPDLAGHGDTGFNRDWDYSAPAQAARVKRLLDQLAVSKVHMVGNSMGGFISAHFALKYPEHTLSATLIDPAGVQSPIASDMQRISEQQQRNLFFINNHQEFDEFYAMTMANPPWVPSILLKAVSERYQQRQPELRKIFDDFYNQDMLDKLLPEITTPTLLLWGEQDRILHVSSVEVWEAGLPNVQTHIFPDVGHLPMVEVPAESAQIMQQFITRLPE